jgi:O-antigen/teichoic acid export membrane protein
MTEDQNCTSIASRFSASLIFTIIRGVINLFTGVLIARWLGPEDYGRMAFLLAIFISFRQLIDMSSSSAFFTFLSQRRRSRDFVAYYWYWVGFQFFIALVVVALLLPDDLASSIWMGESKFLVILALTAVFMQSHVWNNAMQMAEAQRKTFAVQKINTLIVFSHLVMLSILWLFDQLILPLIFTVLIIEWAIASLLALRLYNANDRCIKTSSESHDTVLSVTNEFLGYCMPFVPYVWLSFAHTFADRWLLQYWGGAKEQAYFSVALQFSAIALLATTSILKIFWKEVAEAHHRREYKKLESLYRKTSKRLYFFGAFLCAGILPWSNEIVLMIYGEMYLDGMLVFSLMLLYPVHQSMGQIGSTMLYATEKSVTQVKIGLWFMASSLIVVYFMLAPKDMFVPGLEMGSEGLALKMVVMQLIQVNVIAWFVSRFYNWKFDWLYQFIILGFLIVFGMSIKVLVINVLAINVIVSIFIAGFFYTIIVVLLIYMMPWIVDMDKELIQKIITKYKFNRKSEG